MRRYSLFSTLLLLCAALAACSVAIRRGTDAADDRAAIEEASRRFSAAFVRGDAGEMASLYTDDAVIFPNNAEAIRGREAIRRYWTLPPERRVTRHVATPTEIRVAGNVAHDYGTYEISGVRAGQPYGPYRGNYVIVWRRGPDGWRMELDMWNARPAPPDGAAGSRPDLEIHGG